MHGLLKCFSVCEHDGCGGGELLKVCGMIFFVTSELRNKMLRNAEVLSYSQLWVACCFLLRINRLAGKKTKCE